MAHVIEVWAPWMTPDERAAYVQHVWGLDLYQRIQTARELGEQLGLTNATREALKLWRFLPIDKTDDELAEQRAAKRRAKATTRRRAKEVGSERITLPHCRADSAHGRPKASADAHGREGDQSVSQVRYRQ